jgi:cobalt/nickel transport system ATP-binding protein
VIILDEPTAGLDPQGVGDIMRLIREMQEKYEITVVFATHDIDIVPLYADYVYVMDQGSLILGGKPDENFPPG